MAQETVIKEREQKLREMKLLLKDIDNKLMSLSKELNWNYDKLLQEKPSDMVICTFNSQHKVTSSKIKEHEEKCCWIHQGYMNDDKPFPEYSGSGSCVTLTPDLVHSITQKVSSSPEQNIARALPQTSANFDQNFSREEKLAIYDYVIANTQNQKSYSDLWLQPVEKTKEKKEMAAWEIAAAERDAKRRRASYRNKVHTNRKTHTEILREVINSQMEAFESEARSEKSKERTVTTKPSVTHRKSHSHDSTESWEKRKDDERSHREERKEEKDRKERNNGKSRSHERHSKHRDRKRSGEIGGSDSKCGSRSEDKYRKWKSYEGRSHSHRSSHSSHRR